MINHRDGEISRCSLWRGVPFPEFVGLSEPTQFERRALGHGTITFVPT